MSDPRITARIKGRQTARDLYGLFVNVPDGHGRDVPWADGTGADFAEAFLEEFRELLPQRSADKPKEVPPVPIARLGATKIPFGRYSGSAFDDVPLDYLDWLCRSQEDSCRDLRAYLKHPELESRRRGLDH